MPNDTDDLMCALDNQLRGGEAEAVAIDLKKKPAAATERRSPTRCCRHPQWGKLLARTAWTAVSR
jgi:hypothetical protein